MCYNCGCGMPDDDMGHADNITNKTFEVLASTFAKSVQETKKLVYDYLTGSNTLSGDEIVAIDEMLIKASAAWGQSIDDAKKETLHLLKREVK